jgi:hypothetical protein
VVAFLCIGEPVATVTDALSGDNCPLLQMQPAVLVDKGVCTTIEWIFRDGRGNPVDLTFCAALDAPDSPASFESSASSLSNESSLSSEPSLVSLPGLIEGATVVVRFRDAVSDVAPIYEAIGDIYDAAHGVVRFAPPADVVKRAGIYTVQIALADPTTGRLYAASRGLISVERGLFGDVSQVTGPPTLMEIRLQARDYADANLLLGNVEYSDNEIVFSIVRPIQEFNELSPPLSAIFSAASFPWRYQWMNAILGNLMRIAADGYRRNRLPVAHGGITVDDKNKDNPYWTVSQQLLQEWRSWMLQKKVELNAREAWGTFASPYGGGHNGHD